MATAARQNKQARKGGPEPAGARRTPAWTGARPSPNFSPSGPPRPLANTSPTPQATFPPLTQTNGTARPDNARDRVLNSIAGLTGTTITLTTKTGQRYEGVVGSVAGEGDTLGVTLKDAKELTNPGAPLKDHIFVASANIENWNSGPADAKPTPTDSFRTDSDISHKKAAGRERELQQWVPHSDGPGVAIQGGDDDTFGPGTANTSWDQFSANEQMFGVKTSFDEDVYTTKIDRSAPDFKERERKAQRIANEIVGVTSNNPHIAEERGFVVDDSGINEEDKYGAVVRGTNAYVPPGARKPGALSPPSTNIAIAKQEIPKVSVNSPDGVTTQVAQTQSPSSSKAPSPVPAANANKPPADPLPAFRDFVTNERHRLTQRRQALVKSDMDKKMAELVKFSQSFKLNKPIPDDLVPILAKDEDKQRAIRAKATTDASSTHARAIGASTAATASRGLVVAGSKASDQAARKAAAVAAAAAKTMTTNATQSPSLVASPKGASAAKTTSSAEGGASKKPAINMFIQTIPPFKGGKTRAASNGTTAASTPALNGTNGVNGTPMLTINGTGSARPTPPVASPVSPSTAAANRLNKNASSFRPNPNANAFAPTTSVATMSSSAASGSPKAKPEGPTPPNAFFGSRPIKKSPPVHIKDDFNPFKHNNKMVEPAQVSAVWPYNGKRYMQMFPPPPQHQPMPHPSHMAPQGAQPIPPPSYEEDSAAQAAAAHGYVYAYPPYGYPGQPMMPGMAPPGPPGAYMPGPFMQPMPYPPGMPPPNAMYSPGMGQMPPPQAYMPPPPGAYPPPPNGGGPRPSMPPTPIPAHAHPYYHQSPQLQHAVPYQMMMPPPPNVPPHPYDGGPAQSVQMGGRA